MIKSAKDPADRGHRPSKWRRAVHFSTAAAGLAIVTELMLRSWIGLGDPPLFEPHPSIEYVLKPGVYHRFGNRISVNSAGMRSPEASVSALPPGSRRVLVIGDSIINGGSFTDDSDLGTSLLESRLSEGLPTTVCNISAGSWGPANWLAFLRERGTYSAELALLVVNDGDAADVPTFGPLGPDYPTSRPLCAIWEVLVRYVPRYLPASFGKPPPSPLSAESLHGALDDLDRCIVLLRGAGIMTCVILVPSEAELVEGIGQGRTAIRARLESRGVPFVMADERLQQALSHGVAVYRDGVHLSAAGQRVLAECCLDALQAIESAGVMPSGPQ
jgi:hypothetical protein